jgi:sec-independent protein translocase protein TatA
MNIGFREILLILLIILILFGAKRIPEMMRAMGEGLREFKKAAKDLSPGEEEEPTGKSGAAGSETEKKSV